MIAKQRETRKGKKRKEIEIRVATEDQWYKSHLLLDPLIREKKISRGRGGGGGK